MKQLRTYLALVAMAGFIFLGLWALLALMRYGSCASGGNYVSTRQCAPGTGLKIMELMLSIFGTLIATGIAAVSGGSRPVWAVWALVSGMLASYFFVIAFGPSLTAPDETSAQTPALIGGIVFAVLALPAIWGATKRGASDSLAGGVQIMSPVGGPVRVHAPQDGGPAAIVLAAQQPTAGGGFGITPMGPPTPSTAGDGSAVGSQIAALDQLRRSGALTPAEFEAAKARLLGRQ